MNPLSVELKRLVADAQAWMEEDGGPSPERIERLLERVEQRAKGGTPVSPVAVQATHGHEPMRYVARCALVCVMGLLAEGEGVRSVSHTGLSFQAATFVQPPTPPAYEVFSVPQEPAFASPEEKDPAKVKADPPEVVPIHENAGVSALVPRDIHALPKAPTPIALASVHGGPGGDRTSLPAELSLIHKAREAVRGGELAQALAILKDHERRFRNGQLTQERERLLIEASFLQGDVVGARSRAAAFHRLHPDSLLLPSIQRALDANR